MTYLISQLICYFLESQADEMQGPPETIFHRLTPLQCAGYLLWLAEHSGESPYHAYETALIAKAKSTEYYRHWAAVVEILKNTPLPQPERELVQ